MTVLFCLIGVVAVIGILCVVLPMRVSEARAKADTIWKKIQVLVTAALCAASLMGYLDIGILIVALIAVDLIIRLAARLYEKGGEGVQKEEK